MLTLASTASHVLVLDSRVLGVTSLGVFSARFIHLIEVVGAV